jgi:hypothetical protein
MQTAAYPMCCNWINTSGITIIMLCVPARGEIPARSHCPPAAAATPPTRQQRQTRGSNKFGVGLNYSFIPHAAAGETKTRDKKRTRFLLFAPLAHACRVRAQFDGASCSKARSLCFDAFVYCAPAFCAELTPCTVTNSILAAKTKAVKQV